MDEAVRQARDITTRNDATGVPAPAAVVASEAIASEAVASEAVASEAVLPRLRALADDRLAELVPPPPSGGSRAQAAMHHALTSPGRRLRPQMALLVAGTLGGPAAEAAALDPALAIEMIHAASLVMDDLPCMDDAATRRGVPSTHVLFGEPLALLASVGLVNAAYATIAASPGPAETRIAMAGSLASAVGTAGLVLGQERDLAAAEPDAERLGDIHHRKTGVLFVAAVEIGALAAGCAPDSVEIAALRRFAHLFGLAFQALDDIRDGDGQDDGRPSVVTLLGREGAARAFERRVEEARAVLSAAGDRLATLAPHVQGLLGGPAPGASPHG